MNSIDILVVEDEANLREMLVIVLEEEGYNVHSAIDGNEAWSLIQKNAYNLLLTDLYMPKMNGFELITKLQSTLTSTKMILCSGGGKDFEAEHCSKIITFRRQALKVDCFLSKPYSLNDMLKIIEELIKESK